MFEVLTIVPVVVVAYVATNLDNFSLLVTLFARYRDRRSAVAAGFVAGTALLGAAGFAIGEAAEVAPLEYLGFLGILPVAIGCLWLYRLIRPSEPNGSPVRQSGGTAFVVTVTSQLGNGADTIITFGVLFADTKSSADYLVGLTLVAMSAVFVVIAHYGVSHPQVGQWIERYAQRVAPFIMIGVGAYIIANTATDIVPG